MRSRHSIILSFLFSSTRDLSSSTLSNQQCHQLSLVFDPVHHTMDVGLSNNHNSQTIRYRPGSGHQYKNIFHNIELPKYTEDSIYNPEELDELADCRFYVAIRAPSSFCWKIEFVDGGKLYSINREVPPFPTLSEIVRFKLHQGLEEDPYCKTRELIYGSTRWDFLNNIFYPEICSQLDLFITKLKLSTQLAIATRELDHRLGNTATVQTPQQPSLPQTSFSDLTDNELSTWIEDTKKLVCNRKLRLSPTRPKLDLAPNDFFTIPVNHNSGFRYSFVKHDNRAALPTAFLIAQARHFRRNACFLSQGAARLAERCPYKVCPISTPNENHFDNIDCVRTLLNFLSYGFFDAMNYT